MPDINAAITNRVSSQPDPLPRAHEAAGEVLNCEGKSADAAVRFLERLCDELGGYFCGNSRIDRASIRSGTDDAALAPSGPCALRVTRSTESP